MLIQITNTRRMGCPHCMDAATPEPNHMTIDTFFRAMDIARRLNVRAIVISGGEPTENPLWAVMIDQASERFQSVSIPTNGAWLFSPINRHKMTDLLRTHDNVKLQVSSFPGLYKDHEKTVAAVKEYALELKALGLKKRLHLETDRRLIDDKMIELGRCKLHPELAELARRSSKTASCVPGSVVSAQTTLDKAIPLLESRGQFCKPMVGFDGGIRFSESYLCPAFASVHDPYGTIIEKAHAWRPCGGCDGFRKFKESTDPKYMMARMVLGVCASPITRIIEIDPPKSYHGGQHQQEHAQRSPIP